MIDKDSDRERMMIALSKEILSRTEVAIILKIADDYPKELVDNLALETALKYWSGEISFDEGDIIINNIFIGSTVNENSYNNFELPTIAWECFLAFDSGEFNREGDDKTFAPPEKYTKPLVEILLKKNKLIPQ